MEPPQPLSHLSFAFKSTCYREDIQTQAGAHPEGQVMRYPWSKRWGGGWALFNNRPSKFWRSPEEISPSPAHNKGHLFCKRCIFFKGIFAKTLWCWEGKGEAGLVLKKWDEKGPGTWVQVTRKSELHWWKMPRDKGRQGLGFSAQLQALFREFDCKIHQCDGSWIIVKRDFPSST